MIEILMRILDIVERVKNMEELSAVTTGVFGVLLVFGILNCILGYRLLRFWMMLGGFSVGAGVGAFVASTLEISDKISYAGIVLVIGIVLGILAFLIYKVGVFVLSAGIGISLSIYILHPTSSSVFFVCVLIGVGLGTLAVKYSREVIIVSTSLMGGTMAGFALAKLGEMQEFPYGALMSVGFAILGMLIQFAVNKPVYEEKEEGAASNNEKKKKQGDEYLDHVEEGLGNYLDDYVVDLDKEETQKYAVKRSKKRNLSDTK